MGLRDRLAAFRSPPRASKPLGRSGTINTSGFISEQEANLNWRWPNSLDTIEEMRRTDPTIRWMLALLKTPIRAAMWTVEPAGADDEAREHAGFAEAALFEELDGGWDDFLRRALAYLDFGHSVFERVAEATQVRFTYEREADGEEVEVEREAFVVRRLAERLQRTVREWHPDARDRSKLDHVVQWLGDGVTPSSVPIPAERLVVLTNEQEGDDWRGTSLLRPAWQSYDYKLKLENLEAIAYERSMGVPIVYPPKDADDTQLDSMEEGLKDLYQRSGAYGIMPGPKADTLKDDPEAGWLFEVVSISGDADRSASEAIGRHEASMARNVLAEFMRLGHEQTGARATADVQQDPYYQAVEAHVRYIEDVVTEQVIAPLIRWNYGDEVPIPRLKASKITAKNVDVVGDIASKLIGSNAIGMNLETENALRDLLDLPQRKPDQEDDRPQAPAPEPLDKPNTDPGEGDEGNQPEPGRADPKALSDRPFAPWRELRPEERYVALADISRKLDRSQDSFAAIVENAAQPEVERAWQQAKRARSPEEVAQVTVDPFAIADAIERQLQTLHDEGRRQVRAELRRQGAGLTFEEIPLPRRRTFLAQALTAAQGAAQAATRSIRAWALRVLEQPEAEPPTGPGFEPFASLRLEAGKVSLGLTSEAFNAGRTAEMQGRVAEIATTVYSAVLDENTCGPCRLADGREAEPPGDPEFPVPNPSCEGGGACRCMWIPVIREIAPVE